MNTLLHIHHKRGFTIIELMIVMVLLSILALVGLPTFTGSQKKSRDNKRKTDLAQVAKVLEMYFNDVGSYPCSSSGVMTNCVSTTYAWGGSFAVTNASAKTTVYMQKLPKDPLNTSYYYEVPSGAAGKKYQLWARLERTDDPDLVTNNTTIRCGAEYCNYVLRSSNIIVQ